MDISWGENFVLYYVHNDSFFTYSFYHSSKEKI